MASLVLCSIVLLGGVIILWRAPALAFALFALPPSLFLLQQFVVMHRLYAALRDTGLVLDNIPNIWFFWLTLVASAGLLGYLIGRYGGAYAFVPHWLA